MKKIYSANFRRNDNIFIALRVLLEQAFRYRWQIWITIKKTIHATYQQDVFGLFWSIVMPIVPMTVYIVLAYIKVFKTVDNMPFVYFISTGMLVWLLMATSIHAITKSIKAEKEILTTTNFPIFPTLLSRLGEVVHDTSIRFIIVALILFFYQIDVSLSSLFFAILSLIPAIIFTLGLGMIFSIFDVVAQDTRRIIVLVLRYGLFFSSVIFPFPKLGIAGTINQFNFFNTYVNATRDILYYGHMNHPSLYFYTSIVGVLIFVFAAKLLYTMDYKIRAYL